MKRILFPLKPDSQGQPVADLQEGLQLLLERDLIQLSPNDQPTLPAAFCAERVQRKYGPATTRLVTLFQALHPNWQPNGTVFEPTAKALNALLEEMGAFDTAQPDRQRLVGGQVRRQDRRPIAGAIVRAFHRGESGPVRLGEDVTDQDGRYSLHYRDLPGVAAIRLVVTASDRQGSVLAEVKLENPPQALEMVDLVVPAEADARKWYVSGRVNARASAAMSGLRVRIVDKNIGDDVRLVDALTDDDGKYEATFLETAFSSRGKTRPDLQARVLAGNVVIGASEVRYNAKPQETLNVELPDTAVSALRSEHETLKGAVARHFKGHLADIEETDERRDITYLANKTGWDARAVALASLAEQFSARTIVAGEPRLRAPLFYAMFRAGLPANESAIYRTSSTTVHAVWTKAMEQGVIPPLKTAELEAAVKGFETLAVERALDAPALIGLSPLKELLSLSLTTAGQHERFAQIYTRLRADLPKFWQEVTSAFGDSVAGRLRLNGQLAYLTLNNAPLIRKLHAEAGQNGLSDTVQLVDQGYYRADKWLATVGNDKVPKEVPGTDDNKERQQRYSDLLAAQVRLSFPTRVVAQMVSTGETPVRQQARQGVREFLIQHHGNFEIGRQPVVQYVNRNNLQVAPEVLQEITRIQRVYQITPGDTAMNVLLHEGIDSAQAVTRYSRQEFVKKFEQRVGGETNARLIHAKAQQVHNAVLNIVMSYLTAANAPGIGVHSDPRYVNPAPGPNPNTTDVIAYSTLEDLFGSMDYCECDHCRSILSPAAYLVDLLFFCDREEAELENPLTVLLERRPDLQHLPLTCENTNTPLPYIDIVNETLEYYITHGLSLANYEGHTNDGSARPEELLANPQFVTEAAYTTLAGKPVVPGDAPPLLPPTPPLPFHQPLEKLRRYVAKFDVSLSTLMEVLRPNDNLERLMPADPEHPVAYGWRDILMEDLHLSREEYGLITDRTRTLQQLYGYPETTSQEQVLSDLSKAKKFAVRMAISYIDLVEILRTRFVNPGSFIVLITQIEPGGTGREGTFDTLEFRYINPDMTASPLEEIDFVRLYRFIRLWKKLGWTIDQTDRAISSLWPVATVPDDRSEAERLDDGFLTILPRLAVLGRMSTTLKLKPAKDFASQLACFAPIDTHGETSLYRQMFLSPAKLDQDPAFADDDYGNVLAGGAMLLEHTPALRAAFALTDEEFTLIAKELNFDERTALTLPNISAMFRRGWLARKLKLSVREFLLLTRFTGIDPFAAPDPVNPPILRFQDLVGRLRALSFKPAQALYLIWNEDLSGQSAPLEEEITAFARSLRSELATITREFTVTDDLNEETASARMALVYGKEATDLFFGLLNQRVVTDVGEKTRVFFERYPELQTLHDTYIISTGSPEQKRATLLAALLPQLEKRRKQQRSLQALSEAIETDIEYATKLADDPKVLRANDDPTCPVLDDILGIETSSKISGIWTGYLEAPENGLYDLRIDTDSTSVRLTLDGEDVSLAQSDTQWRSTSKIELRAGGLYDVELTVEGTATVRWQTLARGWEEIPSQFLYSATHMDLLCNAYVRLKKALALANALNLSAAETAYLTRDGWLNALPVTGSPAPDVATTLFAALSDVFEYARLKSALGATDDRLLAVLRNPVTAAQEPDKLLFTLTRWEPESRDALLVHFGHVRGVGEEAEADRGALADISTFARVFDAYAWVKKLRIPATTLIASATNEPDAELVRDFQNALRACYEESTWLGVLKPINDEMRALQREALVAYILHQMRATVGTAHIDTPEKLFEYFLMDVQMQPCMQTSRIRHALSSVQLFIDRCLMNLERRVAPASINATQWEWMRRYRVWEANRKIFLFPENWLEPELRDDKSVFFNETMSELLQSDITDDAAASALINYLSKLEEVSKLEPCGIHYAEYDASKAEDDVVHVVARTSGARRKYFYRRREYGGWTPWEPIKLDIEDNPVIPVVWKDRLFLFWLKIIQEVPLQSPPQPPPSEEGNGEKKKVKLVDVVKSAMANSKPSNISVKAILCWSEYYDGKWQPVKTSDPSRSPVISTFKTSEGKFDRSALRLSLFAMEDVLTIVAFDSLGAAAFKLHNTHSLPEIIEGRSTPVLLWPSDPGRVVDTSDRKLAVKYHSGYYFFPSCEPIAPTMLLPILTADIQAQTIEPRHPLLDAWNAPFFYEDSRHVFYVTSRQDQVLDWELAGVACEAGTFEEPPEIPQLVLPSIPEPIDTVVDPPALAPVLRDINSKAMKRFVTEDAYIHRGLDSAQPVRFGESLIGPRGSFDPDTSR